MNNQYTQQDICNYLTFEEAVQLREALGTAGLDCLVPVNDPDGQIKFLKGVNPQTIQIYRLIKEEGGSINALVAMAVEGNIEQIRLLLDSGVNVNVKELNFGATPLAMAATFGKVDVIRLLLERGANINQTDATKSTPLMLAVESNLAGENQLETVRLLINAGADLSATDRDGNSALMRAIPKENIEIIRLVLNANPNLLIENRFGSTALSKAMTTRNNEIIQLITDKLAENQ